MSGTMNTGYAKGTTTTASGCACPVCQGLQTFSSPLYSSGALLTADDLSSEQAFVRAKSRLQNRHLHGWGTVCGLEVVCDDCDGVVRIKPGYALDPCGNDIVLAEAAPFNVVKAIQACTMARPKIGDCNPYIPPPDPGCQDVDTYWCVTLRFNEVQTAQTAQFLRQAVSPGGCSCGGKGGCTCGGTGGCQGGGATSTAGALSYVTPNCTPRRLLECVEIGIERHDGPCAPQQSCERDPTGHGKSGFSLFGGLETLAPHGSLLRRLILCVEQALATLRKRLTDADAAALEALGTGIIPQGMTANAMHDALCRLRQALLDFLMCHDPVRCQMLAASAGTLIPAVQMIGGAPEPADQYAQRVSSMTQALMMAWVQAGADCLCGALLPPCPGDPLDMRVPIACVTVRGNKIVDICNHTCRRYAGSFPSLYYWLSVVPIVPILSRAIALLCCSPDAAGAKSGLWSMLGAMDPTGAWRKVLMQNKFAVPAMFLRTLGSIDFNSVLAAFRPTPDPVETASAMGRNADEAIVNLAKRGVPAEMVTVPDGDSIQTKLATAASTVVASGSHMNLLVANGTVVGLNAAKTAADIEDLRAQIATLTTRLDQLGGKI